MFIEVNTQPAIFMEYGSLERPLNYIIYYRTKKKRRIGEDEKRTLGNL